MIWATEYKHVELVKLLLSKGSDINIRDNVSLWLLLVLSRSWRRMERPGCAASTAEGSFSWRPDHGSALFLPVFSGPWTHCGTAGVVLCFGHLLGID